MITLEQVSKCYPTRQGWRTVIDDISVSFPRGRNIGILGRNGSGKSTLIRLLARAEEPTEGRISWGMTVSWPLGFSIGYEAALTGVDNVRTVARLYGRDWREILVQVEDIAALGDYIRMPMITYSSGMRSRFALALSLAIDFECYLLDEVMSVADPRFGVRLHHAFMERREKCTFLIVSHNVGTVKKYCDEAYVMNKGRLESYDDVTEAVKAYRLL